MGVAPGARIGPYEVGELIGAGGMGEVYRARDTKLGRSVALKFLPDLFTADPDRLARFHREAQLLASLNHTNIGQIYGFEDGAAKKALALELVEGPTLADRIAQGPLPLEEALPIARQVADALEAAHEQGVVHRDLKPANIKIARDGTVKVLDFGLAKALDPAGAPADAMNSPTLTARATQLGIIVGTAAYMAPEQARGKTVDRRADIWAFGCVLYEMLTGRRAFEGETITDTIAAVLQRDPDWSRLPAETPPRVRQLLQRALEKDPRQRLRDIGDARLEIADAVQHRPEIAAGAPVPAVARDRRRWPLTAAIGVAIAALLLAAAAWLLPGSWPRSVTRLELTTPPTAEPGLFAVAPSGRHIVFSAKVPGGVSQLWLRSFDQRAAKPLPGTEEGDQPFWSPDERSIGFFAGGRLKRLDFATGVVQALWAAPTPRGGTWNADGVIVFAPNNSTVGLYRISADGGPATAVTHLLSGQYSHRWPQFLPDRRRVLFSTYLGDPATRGLFVTALEGGEPRRILDADDIGDAAPLYAAPGTLLILRKGVLLARRFDPETATLSGEPVPVAESVGTDAALFRSATSASANVLAHRPTATERRQLELVERTGHVVARVGPADDNVLANPSIAPDGRHVAVSRVVDGNKADIWLLDIKRGTFTRVISDASNNQSPLWSPDGSQLAFRSSRTGSFDVYLKSMQGSGGAETVLVANQQTKTPLDWSPDGRTLLFSSLDPETGADLWAIDTKGERKPYPVLHTKYDEMDGQISPDGKWMAYRSNESGKFEIYVRPFAPEGRTQFEQLISTAGGSQPRWNPSGKELFYISPDGQMMSVPLDESADRQSISSGAPVALFATHLASGTFITTSGSSARAQYEVTREGKFLINSTALDYVPPPISVVLNWDVLLPARR